VSENRFLKSFSALLASAILVCSTHLLLIASQEYGRPDLEPATAPVVTSAPASAPVPARESIDVEVTGTTETASHPDADKIAGAHTSLSPAPDQETPAPEAKTETSSTTEETAKANVPASEVAPPQGTDEASPPQQVAEAAPDGSPEQASPFQATEEAPPVEQAEATAPSAEPAQEESNAPAVQPAVREVAAQPTASEAAPIETPEAVAPPATAAVEEAAPALPKPAEVNEIAPTAPAPAPVAIEPEASSAPKLAEADATPKAPEATKARPAVANVPLPTRKPRMAAAKPVAPLPEPKVQQAAAEAKPRWTPMTLAPADKDTVAKPLLAPKRAESASGYNAKIWSALAHHKPRVGKTGSAVVTFAVGPGGGLRSARISGSSGDSQLDQMALQTVRNAAPFPPPPNPASASYTIRIYFR
jgi:periplasmic protein TonB